MVGVGWRGRRSRKHRRCARGRSTLARNREPVSGSTGSPGTRTCATTRVLMPTGATGKGPSVRNQS
eukprot:9485799-Alexandrium_andersonii.AAC.1